MKWPDDFVNKVLVGDCLEILPLIPDGAVDAVITDPPYGIGAHNGIGKYGRLKQVGNKEKWDKFAPDLTAILGKCEKQIVWGGNYFNLPPSRCWLVWDKGEGFYGRDFAEVELAWTSLNENSKIFKYDPLANRDYHEKSHPTQKPLALMAWIISKWTKPNDLILDPYCGSGSTLVAAKQLGRRYIGIEISPKYVDICNQRLAQEELFNQEGAGKV